MESGVIGRILISALQRLDGMRTHITLSWLQKLGQSRRGISSNMLLVFLSQVLRGARCKN